VRKGRRSRFGRTLDVLLTPPGAKTCNFNCAYCPLGPTEFPGRTDYPPEAAVVEAVARALRQDAGIDAISVAGHGEATLHPAFASIAAAISALRDRLTPRARLALLTNGSMLDRSHVAQGLGRFDVCSVKLDAGDGTTFRLMNGPSIPLTRLVATLERLPGVSLRATFVQDLDRTVENTTPRALAAWLDAVDRIRPASVDIATIVGTPARGTLLRVPPAVLQAIASRVAALGIEVRVAR
jgi:wyosine [tRNA(Phe)-imidazoG37] synthetase (radical SAM superfamily)